MLSRDCHRGVEHVLVQERHADLEAWLGLGLGMRLGLGVGLGLGLGSEVGVGVGVGLGVRLGLGLSTRILVWLTVRHRGLVRAEAVVHVKVLDLLRGWGLGVRGSGLGCGVWS